MSEQDIVMRAQPFSNGTEYTNWLLNNCCECKWGSENNGEHFECPVEFMFDKAHSGDGKTKMWFHYVAGIGKDRKCKVKDTEEEFEYD